MQYPICRRSLWHRSLRAHNIQCWQRYTLEHCSSCWVDTPVWRVPDSTQAIELLDMQSKGMQQHRKELREVHDGTSQTPLKTAKVCQAIKDCLTSSWVVNNPINAWRTSNCKQHESQLGTSFCCHSSIACTYQHKLAGLQIYVSTPLYRGAETKLETSWHDCLQPEFLSW